MAGPGKKVRWVAYGLMALIAIALVLLILEVRFRFDPQYGRAGYRFDPHLVYRLTPGLAAQKPYAWGKTGRDPFVLRFNNRGFRGSDFKKQKPAGVTRVMIIGDSYTAGLDYPDEEIFSGQLQQRLNAGAGGPFEVLNASCPAWGADQYFLYWKREGRRYRPDYLILMVSPNDMREMFNKGLLHLDEGGGIQVKPATLPFRERLGWGLATRSAFFQYLQQKVLKTNYGDFFRVFHFFPVNYGQQDSTDWDMPVYLKDPFPAVTESYRLLEKVLLDIKADGEKEGTRLLLAKIPTKAELDGSYQQEGLDPEQVIRALEAIAGRDGIPFLDLNAALSDDPEPLRIFMDWEYHFDKDGHDFVAEQLYRFLTRQMNR